MLSIVTFVTNRRGPNGYIRTKYTSEEIDAVAAYCPELDVCFLLPIELVDGDGTIHAAARSSRKTGSEPV